MDFNYWLLKAALKFTCLSHKVFYKREKPCQVLKLSVSQKKMSSLLQFIMRYV